MTMRFVISDMGCGLIVTKSSEIWRFWLCSKFGTPSALVVERCKHICLFQGVIGMSNAISCPNCRTEIEISEVLQTQLSEQIRAELEAELQGNRAEVLKAQE